MPDGIDIRPSTPLSEVPYSEGQQNFIRAMRRLLHESQDVWFTGRVETNQDNKGTVVITGIAEQTYQNHLLRELMVDGSAPPAYGTPESDLLLFGTSNNNDRRSNFIGENCLLDVNNGVMMAPAFGHMDKFLEQHGGSFMPGKEVAVQLTVKGKTRQDNFRGAGITLPATNDPNRLVVEVRSMVSIENFEKARSS